MQDQSRTLPNASRVGVLTAAVLLTFALTRILPAPEFTMSLQLPGFYFGIPLTLGLAMTLLAAGLTATGMDWLLRPHPGLNGAATLEHWLLPTLTTLVIGSTLPLLAEMSAWWFGFAISSALLLLVFLAEYIVIEPAAPQYAAARAGLTALSYALFLILTVFLRLAGARLIILIPVLFVASALIALRILHLDGSDRWDFPWAAGIGLACVQLGASLHYWPLMPQQLGLVLTGVLYALTTLSSNVTDGIPLGRASLWPVIILAVTWGASIFLR
jgi:hypothetical protein